MIRPDNDQRSLFWINAIGFIGMAMSRVVALIISIHLEQTFLLPFPCYRSEELWDLILLDLLPVTGDDEHAINDAVWVSVGRSETLDDLVEGLRDLKATLVMRISDSLRNVDLPSPAFPCSLPSKYPPQAQPDTTAYSLVAP